MPATAVGTGESGGESGGSGGMISGVGSGSVSYMTYGGNRYAAVQRTFVQKNGQWVELPIERTVAAQNVLAELNSNVKKK